MTVRNCTENEIGDWLETVDPQVSWLMVEDNMRVMCSAMCAKM